MITCVILSIKLNYYLVKLKVNDLELIKKLDKNLSKYRLFYHLLIENNKKFNLTAITEEKEVMIKHFVDSMCLSDIFEVGSSVVEVGSGAGFPSIPIKIEREDLDFTLIESNNKKCGFLQSLVDGLQLKTVTVVCNRAEVIGKDKNFRETFDYAVARAVAKINVLMEYCAPLLKVGGKMVFWKGESLDEELSLSQNAMKILNCKVDSVLPYDLGEYGKRYLVVIKKYQTTSSKYPRGLGKEKKSPL